LWGIGSILKLIKLRKFIKPLVYITR